MNRAEALQALHLMLSAAQKSRSVLVENYGEAEAEMIGEMTEPWLWGERCFVPALAKAIDRYEHGVPISGGEFHNWMVLARRSPSVMLAAYAQAERDLPEPDVAWWGEVWA